jgi:hypothetical protein
MAEPLPVNVNLVNYIIDLINRVGPMVVLISVLLAVNFGWVPNKSTDAVNSLALAMQSHDATTRAQQKITLMAIQVLCRNTFNLNDQWRCDQQYFGGEVNGR